jgi:HEAT repeat protein
LLRDPAPEVRAFAVAAAARRHDPALNRDLIKLTEESNPRVLLELAFALGNDFTPEATDALAGILAKRPEDRWISSAVLSSASGRALELLARVEKGDNEPLLNRVAHPLIETA